MVEIRKGIIISKHSATQKLEEFFISWLWKDFDWILYLAYPIIVLNANAKAIDAVWISEKYWIIAFNLIEEKNISSTDENTQLENDIYFEIKNKLLNTKELREWRELLVDPIVVTYVPFGDIKSTWLINKAWDFFGTKKTVEQNFLNELLRNNEWKHPHLYKSLLSTVQSIIKLKSEKNRKYIKNEASKWAMMRNIENTIANLDYEQETAIISFEKWIQRIRWLAGSWKTIVLALKAAYIHSTNPEAEIAITFQTRALKSFYEKLIQKFFITQTGEEPDWSKIHIIQAWWSPKSTGVYYEYCTEKWVPYLDFKAAQIFKSKDSTNTIFSQICEKAYSSDGIRQIMRKYDYILVDEAQDLDIYFLRMCNEMLKDKNQNLIYAYDELQKLNEWASLPHPHIIFGDTITEDDKILHKCYRNSRPVLATAHALWFWIYREKWLVQLFSDAQLWSDLWYTEKSNQEITDGAEVVLARTDETSPTYLEKIDDIDELIKFQTFSTAEEQAKWIAEEIEKNIRDDELLHDDIMVINPMALTTKKEVWKIRELLFQKKINSHIAWDLNADKFFEDNSITFTGINRAKWNESSIVYIINAQDCFSSENLNSIVKRNILFTAITRSKWWVRVVGVGNNMKKLQEEFQRTKDNNFCLKFTYPDIGEINRINLVHRWLSEEESKNQSEDKKVLDKFMDVLQKLKNEEASIEDFPEYTEILRKFLEK